MSQNTQAWPVDEGSLAMSFVVELTDLLLAKGLIDSGELRELMTLVASRAPQGTDVKAKLDRAFSHRLRP